MAADPNDNEVKIIFGGGSSKQPKPMCPFVSAAFLTRLYAHYLVAKHLLHARMHESAYNPAVVIDKEQ